MALLVPGFADIAHIGNVAKTIENPPTVPPFILGYTTRYDRDDCTYPTAHHRLVCPTEVDTLSLPTRSLERLSTR